MIIISIVYINEPDANLLSKAIKSVADAVSKSYIRKQEKEIKMRIDAFDLFAGVGGIHIDREPSLRKEIEGIVESYIDSAVPNLILGLNADEYISILMGNRNSDVLNNLNGFDTRVLAEYEQLKRQREELRLLRRLKTERVSALIKRAWQNRNHSVDRSSTSAVSDTMLLTIPTPPTALAAVGSLERGGVVVAILQ